MKYIGIITGVFIILFSLTPILFSAIAKLEINPKTEIKLFYICLQILVVISYTAKGIKFFTKKNRELAIKCMIY